MSSISSISSGAANWQPTDFADIQQRLFKKADTDGDGAVSQSELSSLLEKNPRLAKTLSSLVSSADGTTASAADIFKALDADGDGAVTEAQFKTALQDATKAARAGGGDLPPPPPPGGGGDFAQVLADVFAKGDSDGDGYLSQDDLAAMMEKTPGLARDLTTLTGSATSTSASDAFAALDADGDGKVSTDEFTTAVAKAHEQAAAQTSDQSASALFEAFLKQPPSANGYGQDGSATSASAASSVFKATA